MKYRLHDKHPVVRTRHHRGKKTKGQAEPPQGDTVTVKGLAKWDICSGQW